MSAVLDIPVDAARVWDGNFWWPTIPAGYFSFEDSTPEFVCRDQFGEIVLTLGQTPNSNGSYFAVQNTDFTNVQGLLIPAYSWLQLHIAPADTATFASQTLTYEANITPPAAGPKWALMCGKLVFTESIVTPPVVQL